MIAIAEREGTAKYAHGVVVCLLAPRFVAVRDLHEHGIADLQERQGPQFRAPDGIQDLPIPDDGGDGEIMLL